MLTKTSTLTARLSLALNITLIVTIVSILTLLSLALTVTLTLVKSTIARTLPLRTQADPVKAVYWGRKVAEEGDSDAQYDMGIAFLKGDGVPLDPKAKPTPEP